ncbi:bile acid:sodium symporter family protein [Ornithinimicrobium sp. INDO-MA30-4]|uniref:bile acid:sodium symporter family protein n=1 Tax=Ornithinimicrobium sp. INDO-MA30-4 TaxID=2908651 RepID=UPI0021A94762|nr:bile acid:sodium symporter [Ornithinimicrobium sp. INDO-MA30-4]
MTDVDNIRIAFDEGSLLTLKVVLAALLFGIALDTRVADFKEAFRRPKAIAVGIAAQFLVLPGLVFLLTLLLDVRGSVALGMLLVACCPPGNVSNILTHRAKGDVALSVSMTAVGNVIAIFAMAPLFAFGAACTRLAQPSCKALSSTRGMCSARSWSSSASRLSWA